jgi:hypothetical protein
MIASKRPDYGDFGRAREPPAAAGEQRRAEIEALAPTLCANFVW